MIYNRMPNDISPKLSGINPQSNIHFDANNRFVFACHRLEVYLKDAN